MEVKREMMKVRVSLIRLLSISLFWCGYSAYLSSMTIIFLPSELTRMREDTNAIALGLFILTSSLIGGAVSPFFGYLSDTYNGAMAKKVGKRSPFIIIGVLGCSASVVLLATFSTLDNFHITWGLWGISAFFISMAQSSYSAIIPDIVPREQYGTASGCMGFMMMLGTALGGSLGYYYGALGIGFDYLVYVIVGFLVICAGITLCSSITGPVVRNIDYQNLPFCERSAYFFAGFIDPFRQHDFAWVFISRMFIGLGYNMVLLFSQYYIKDILPSPYNFIDIVDMGEDVKTATAFFSTILSTGAMISAFIFGSLSDKMEKKTMVYVSGFIQVLATLPLALPWFEEYYLFVVFGFFAGMGYGGYLAVDWALVCDVLPQAKYYGRDMGLWHLSWAIPQIVAPFLCSFILEGKTNYGYLIVYGLTMISIAVGTFLIKNVRLIKVNTEYALDDFFSNSTDDDFLFTDESTSNDIFRKQQKSSDLIDFSDDVLDDNNLVIDALATGKLDLDNINLEESISFSFSSDTN
eukprot:TRINITY_DN6712_c0_g1_i1.p1 TRINITY_DN6712_c0_g1~~TRINITY_DN6712_c0_g1_i1.p1  ORF type:complete len:522 (+),score=91.47 TRINITY_DN6712_c0_g1_i1:1-1566(+)